MDPLPVNPPTPVGGRPSRLSYARVVTINADGSLDVKATTSRTLKTQVPRLATYAAPAAGDTIVLVEVDGDRQQPLVLGKVLGV